MSTQLRHTLTVVGKEEARAAADELKALAAQPSCVVPDLLRELAHNLTAPPAGYRTALLGEISKLDESDPGAVDKLVQVLLDATRADPSNLISFALARELAAAARLSRDYIEGSAKRLAAADFIPAEWWT